MGHYIEVPTNLHKAQYLQDHHGATKTHPHVSTDPDFVTVCVAQNGPFDAAAICHDQRDVHDFNDPTDPRPRTWLLVTIDVARQLSPSYARYLGKLSAPPQPA